MHPCSSCNRHTRKPHNDDDDGDVTGNGHLAVTSPVLD